jgi:hypothetical protein
VRKDTRMAPAVHPGLTRSERRADLHADVHALPLWWVDQPTRPPL